MPSFQRFSAPYPGRRGRLEQRDAGPAVLEHIAQPEAQTAYCAVINCTPVNPKASPPDAIKDFRPAPERIYAADFSIINKKLPEWDEWYKKEIQAR